MVQVALDEFWSLFAGWHTLLWLVLLLAVLGTLGVLTLRQRGGPPAAAATGWLRGVGAPVGAWLAALLVLALTFAALGILGDLVVGRVGTHETSVPGGDLGASPTTQAAPSASYLAERTYTRTLVVPPSLLRRVGEAGVEALAPYLTDPTSQNVTRLVDQFRRSGQDVLFTRQATLSVEEPIRLDTSRVAVVLEFVTPARGAKRTYYNAAFNAEYAFTNPLDQPVTARFRFPLPEGSGTLSGFKVVVGGQELTAADLSGGSQWEGELSPRQTVTVQVAYAHQGARGWSYLLASRREPIQAFELTVQSSAAAKFAPASLPPTRTSRRLGRTTLSWNLKDVITAQDISMTFSSASLRETLTKLYRFAPTALLLAAAFGALWAWQRGMGLTPASAALATVAVLLGLTLGGVGMSYLPVLWAALIGSVVGGALALRVLGRAWWPAVLIACGSPLAFLLVNQAGLVLTLAALVGLGALIWGRPRHPAAPETPLRAPLP
ncbi:hypothetical protein DKM44_10155 [Deinococcus irradiatisoli]|uniref:Uncharacterized protein n=1 Tax=Deinococcus irradiatisoli TaxID=2202254 RepID=A0A2Z3JES9_9DEIO|nr:hypothetical protein [Deinococcus irradiatisoli]AWN23542.1 hypothetical protein DKM44_10155 [Deinococcus irradiatisoli]